MLRVMAGALVAVSLLGAVCTRMVQSSDTDTTLNQGLSTQTVEAMQEIGLND